jgi:phosphohistidine phosphatase
MITLYLLRHAKSSHAANGGDDKSRPLNDRGRRAAAVMGRHMHDAGFQPSRVFCSTAERTRETLEILGGAAEWAAHDPSREFVDQLYLASPDEILTVLQDLDEATPSALVIGHNPGIHELACALAEPRDGLYRQLLDKYPTGALTVLTTASEGWRTIGATRMVLSAFEQPQSLIG